MSGGCDQQRNQPKLTFRNHSQPLDSISQEKTNPKLYAFREIQNAMNEFLQSFKILFLREFSTALLTHPLTDVFSQV